MSEWHLNGTNSYWFGKKGELCPGWKGGITPENRLVRASVKMIKWRKAVFERDNYTCRKCDKRGSTDLNAHHVKSFSLYPELRFEVDNGVTLCIDCHKNSKLHNKVLIA